MDQGRQKVEHAVKAWREAMQTATWPGYPAGADHIAPPEWSGRRWQEQEQARAMQKPPALWKDKRMADLHRRLARSAGQEPGSNVNVFG